MWLLFILVKIKFYLNKRDKRKTGIRSGKFANKGIILSSNISVIGHHSCAICILAKHAVFQFEIKKTCL